MGRAICFEENKKDFITVGRFGAADIAATLVLLLNSKPR